MEIHITLNFEAMSTIIVLAVVALLAITVIYT